MKLSEIMMELCITVHNSGTGLNYCYPTASRRRTLQALKIRGMLVHSKGVWKLTDTGLALTRGEIVKRRLRGD